MIASILAFLTALLNGGLGKVLQGAAWFASLFMPTIQEQKQRVADETGKESQSLDKGGRPQWDDE